KQSSAPGAKLCLDCFGALRAPRNDKCFLDVVNSRTRTLQKREVRLEAEEVLAHGLEMRAAALQLLRHRVDVAEAALEGAALEDGGGAGRVIGGIRHLDGLLDSVSGGEADRHALLERDGIGALDRTPYLGKRAQEINARAAQARLGRAEVRLHDGTLPQFALVAARRLLLGKGQEGVEESARQAEGDASEAAGEDAVARERVQGALVRALG